jgi:hypothetical protein
MQKIQMRMQNESAEQEEQQERTRKRNESAEQEHRTRTRKESAERGRSTRTHNENAEMELFLAGFVFSFFFSFPGFLHFVVRKRHKKQSERRRQAINAMQTVCREREERETK